MSLNNPKRKTHGCGGKNGDYWKSLKKFTTPEWRDRHLYVRFRHVGHGKQPGTRRQNSRGEVVLYIPEGLLEFRRIDK